MSSEQAYLLVPSDEEKQDGHPAERSLVQVPRGVGSQWTFGIPLAVHATLIICYVLAGAYLFAAGKLETHGFRSTQKYGKSSDLGRAIR